MSQITLRQIPEDLEGQIRGLARKNGTSLNKTIIELLQKSLGMITGDKRNRSVSDIAGTWDQKQYDEFQANTHCFDQIDNEIWQ